MPGYGGPVPNIPPQLLAQMGLAGFKPPPGMQMPGMPGMPPQGQPGMGMGEGMAGLGAGLGALGHGRGLNPNGMPEDAGLAGAVSGVNALQPGANGQFAQPPMPTDIGSGQGGGFGQVMDFLTGWARR